LWRCFAFVQELSRSWTMDILATNAGSATDLPMEAGEEGDEAYVPDLRALWGSEAARAMLVVLTRRLGPDFAREVSDELASRTFSYQAGCPDDQSDGKSMELLLTDQFWDRLFAGGDAK
jgi:hypothetical protein